MKKLLLIGIFFSLCLLGFSQGNRTPGMKKQTGLLVPTVTIQTVTVSPGAVVLPVHERAKIFRNIFMRSGDGLFDKMIKSFSFTKNKKIG